MEVILIGGEVFLCFDWLEIVKVIIDVGMMCSMIIGGFGIIFDIVCWMKEVGIRVVLVFVDGLEGIYDCF